MRLVFVSTKINQKQEVLQNCSPEELVLVVDVDRCISCGACALACQAEHAERFGEHAPVRRIVAKDIPGQTPPRVVNLPTSCRQCGETCPNNTGYSFWSICPGDKAQASVSRFPACDGCEDRLKEGLAPACATRCCMKCIYAGRAEDVRFALEEKRLRSMGETEIC